MVPMMKIFPISVSPGFQTYMVQHTNHETDYALAKIEDSLERREDELQETLESPSNGGDDSPDDVEDSLEEVSHA